MPCLIIAFVEALQGGLKVATVHGQAVAVTCVESTQGMAFGNPLQQSELRLSLGIAGPGDEFGMDHFAFTHLPLLLQNRVREHLAQALKAAGKCCLRDLEEIIGGALTGAGIDLATVPLHITHQAIVEGKTLCAEK
ncbi:hypothetical protein D3C72_2008870 [compost metagenome]